VVTAPAPRIEHDLPFGSLRVSPTTIVAGAPGQELTVTVEPDEAAPGPVTVRIYRPGQLPRDRYGRGITRLELASETLEVEGTAPKTLTLSDLNPPPGRYEVEVLAGGELIGRGAFVVYAQHRLPPGQGPEQVAGGTGDSARATAGGRGGGEAGASRAVRSLPSPSVNHNVSSLPGQQAETYAAVEFDDPGRVIAASNPAPGSNPDAWISNDSMRPGTPVRQTLPSASALPSAEGGGTPDLALCCDPTLAADDRGNLWFSVLTTGGSSHIVINRVPGPDGTTFQDVNAAIPRATTGIQDKPMITVDSWASSPKRYRLYAAWVENPGQNVVISECDSSSATACDNPDNWSLPAKVTAMTATYSYPSVAAAPSGDVYVAWWDVSADHVEIDRCQVAEDCTQDASWDEESDVDTDLDPGSVLPLPFFCPIIAAPGGRLGAQTYVDVGADGRVYVAWSELRNNNVAACTASGLDRTFDSYVAAGAPHSFPAANSGVRLSDDPPGALNDHFFPTLVADPSLAGQVESSLYSTKHDSTGRETHQYYVSSGDGGASFGAMEQITTAASNFSGSRSDGFDYGDYEGAAATGGLFYPSWTDNRAEHGGNSELYMLTQGMAPETTITKGPKRGTRKRKAKFRFISSIPGSTFQCKIDKKPFKPCSSPRKYKKLKRKKHRFQVAATASGVTDPTPAKRKWKVKRKRK
jgi:hypothetical protein